MATATICKKRPCRICRRWFIPSQGSPKTCGDQACQKEWHRRSCARWNKNNAEYFKEIYLDKKLKAACGKMSESTGPPATKSRFAGALPRGCVQVVRTAWRWTEQRNRRKQVLKRHSFSDTEN